MLCMNGIADGTVDPAAPASAARSARARVRVELTREILEAARRQLATEGAAGLSLRAVARELGMVSSALYRYFPSRDDLLTALIIEGYEALAAAVQEAETEAGCPRSDLAGRCRATCRAVRAWALVHPHEYALLYGSPVPGYRAPEATIGPASRVTEGFVAQLREAAAAGLSGATLSRDPAPAVLHPDTRLVLEGVPDELAVRGLMVWTGLFGFISFELFGQFNRVVDEPDALFDAAVTRWAAFVGFAPS
jgi:AcrR family transcriptional regulator